MRDKRVLRPERGADGACKTCKRRHIHTDSCKLLKFREDMQLKGEWENRDRRTESAL